MYIKQIIIQGFKSYKDQIVIEPFSPKHNVIVGRNGSGKSNFFAAIRFVLSDAYTQMGREERQALLHEGSGAAVMSAYVEIIFDNSDDRFPTGNKELILRRTIGMKKDEYSLDRKNATKADVMNLLESAGFSRSNPYYIVPQGRVTTLTNMKDPERLTLLKEVAGTQVYEARRTESIRIMGETDAKRAKIDDLLEFINERLAELEEEKQELKEYQGLDRERRCLEYTIYHREQQEIASALENLEEQRVAGVDATDISRERFLKGEKMLSSIDDDIRELKQRMELLQVDKRQYEEERKAAARDRAKLELDVQSILDGQAMVETSRARFEEQLSTIQSSITQREANLSTIIPSYQKALQEESAIQVVMANAESIRQRLYAKQGRSAKFRTKAERDAWLSKEIEDINVALATRKAVTMQTTEEVTELEQAINKSEGEIKNLREVLDNRNKDEQSLDEEVLACKVNRDKLIDQRKDLWREEARLESSKRNAEHECDRAERNLSHTMDHNTSRGLAFIRTIKAHGKLDGLYGTLAELFTVHERFKTAVEVTAGASLFHYVVDTEETAARAVDLLYKGKAGRITFMPLNKLRPKQADLPASTDAIDMVSKLNFDPMYENAVRHVFGGTVICPNLQVAAHFARTHGVSAITPEGDRSDRKGALSGGYVDPRQSRLDAVQAMSKWKAQCDEHDNRLVEIRDELQVLAQSITRSVGELQKVEQKKQQFEKGYDPMLEHLRSKVRGVQNNRDLLESKQRSKTNVDLALRELAEQQSAYEIELTSDFKKALSKEEEQQLEQLGASIPDLRKQFADLSNRRSELEARKTTIEVELRENLRPSLEQLTSQEHESRTSVANSKLKLRQQVLDRANKVLQNAEKKYQEAVQALGSANASLQEFNQARTTQQQSQEELARSVERSQKRSEKSAAKRALLTEKAAEASRNIRDLGALPEDAYSNKYASISSEKAIKRLHKVNESLKKYSHVNKKAIEQYGNFTRQREDLTGRRSELDKSQQSIRELIEVLDQRKDEAIERTFKQVSREFAGIFERLVPAGRGRLIIQRKSDRVRDEDEASGGERESVENYTGVGIAVSFNSKHDEQQRIQQLSGGQKSLCALALVFAIQQCDPAPFYLFDEIDANLDAQYRTAVAALLEDISSNGQFICTTFRPEMVLVADKCYGVAYSNKTSSIDVVDKQQALDFVEGQISGA